MSALPASESLILLNWGRADQGFSTPAAGQADLAISYGTQINMIVAAGLPLLRVATLIDTPLNTVTAHGGGAIHTLADLRGRSLGIAVSGVEDVILGVMLESAGVHPAEVTIVKVNYGAVPALLTGRLAAAIGVFRNEELLQLHDMGHKTQTFLPEQHGSPMYDELILVAPRARRDDPRLRRFLAAVQVGTRMLLKDPDGMWKGFTARYPELGTELDRASWAAAMPAIAADPVPLDAQRYTTFADFALGHGIIKTPMKLDAFALQIDGLT